MGQSQLALAGPDIAVNTSSCTKTAARQWNPQCPDSYLFRKKQQLLEAWENGENTSREMAGTHGRRHHWRQSRSCTIGKRNSMPEEVPLRDCRLQVTHVRAETQPRDYSREWSMHRNGEEARTSRKKTLLTDPTLPPGQKDWRGISAVWDENKGGWDVEGGGLKLSTRRKGTSLLVYVLPFFSIPESIIKILN